MAGRPSARAFGLCGRIPMEAAQRNLHHARASRAGITRSIRMHNYYTNPLTCKEARGAEAPFRSFRVNSTHTGEGKGGSPVSQEEVTPLSIHVQCPMSLMALSQRLRSYTGTSILSVSPGACSAVVRADQGMWRWLLIGGTPPV